ncbi:MAG: hypothetical protein KGQ60_07070 [Planctomycetes bacterium]|nr:hypothetical protein [Planctomycetota bacterium]
MDVIRQFTQTASENQGDFWGEGRTVSPNRIDGSVAIVLEHFSGLPEETASKGVHPDAGFWGCETPINLAYFSQ